jgi:transcription elongation factor GreA
MPTKSIDELKTLANDYRQAKRAAHGSAQRFPAERVGGRAGHQGSGRSGGFGHSDERTQVTRILDADGHDHERVSSAVSEGARPAIRPFGQGDDGARRANGAECGHDGPRDRREIDAGAAQPIDEGLNFTATIGVTRDRGIRHADSGVQRGGYEVRAVEQEHIVGAARGKPVARDHRVVPARDSAHAALWYYAGFVMKDRLIKKFEDEIAALNYELKLELPKEIKRARELGDLRENAEYHAAKERQRLVEVRISMLQKRVSEIALMNVDRIPRDRAGFGSTLHVLEGTGDKLIFQLVMPEDADAQKGMISTTSPIGRAFLNREQGDSVKVATPGGTREFEILKLITIHDDDEG